MKTTMSEMTAVANFAFDSNASQRGLEKAAKDISTAVEKASQKITDDAGKNSQKAIEAFKSGSEKITDAVARIKIANAKQTATPTPAVLAVCRGLSSVSETTAQLADYFYANPSEWQAMGEKASAANERLGKIVDSVKSCAGGLEQLQTATTEASKMAGWLSSSVCGDSGVGNGGKTQTIPVGNSAFGSLWERYGG